MSIFVLPPRRMLRTPGAGALTTRHEQCLSAARAWRTDMSIFMLPTPADASSLWHVTQHRPAGMTFPDLNAMVLKNEEADIRVNQGAFRYHDKKQKECVRKRAPSIRAKTLRLGQVGDIGALFLYQNPSTGAWHLSVHCTAGMSLPDLNALVEPRRAKEIELPIRAKL
ncbi:hypothetical protein ARSEF4850_009204 [Beauveria asiatica]